MAQTPRQGAMADALQSHQPRRHSRHRKGSDPFMQLPEDMKLSSEPASPNTAEQTGSDGSQSLLEELVLTPLSMISFIFSLFLVDYDQRQWRVSQHANADADSFWERLFHKHPEPYQSASDATWNHSSGASSGLQFAGSSSTSSSTNDNRGWFRRTKHRAMARLELNDALDMKKRVMVAIAAWACLSMLVTVFLARRAFAWAMGQ